MVDHSMRHWLVTPVNKGWSVTPGWLPAIPEESPIFYQHFGDAFKCAFEMARREQARTGIPSGVRWRDAEGKWCEKACQMDKLAACRWDAGFRAQWSGSDY